MSDDHPGIDLKPVLEYVSQKAEICESPPALEIVHDDPDADKFYSCAMASGSTVIVSGDKHLLKASGYQEIDVLKPREFVSKYLA